MKVSKPTWIIHGVMDGPNSSYHTHGMDKYDSLELEINMPLNNEQAYTFINIVGLAIANGRKFQDNDIDLTLFNCEIAFREVVAVHGKGEKVLRIILPDPNFKYPWDPGCQEPYVYQLGNTLD